ncbi:hypothetical protein PATSB16_02290 [Pandoraea thiooxydans]|nr:hypothetical protein PATSB16_02290 [Pandoraea thiooxydans]
MGGGTVGMDRLTRPNCQAEPDCETASPNLATASSNSAVWAVNRNYQAIALGVG